jgi:uncharacterized protein YuzE
MRFRYDPEVDALSIRLLEGSAIARTEQLEPGTLVDLSAQGHVIAIELVRPARDWPIDEIEQRFHIDPHDAAVLRGMWEDSYPYGGEVAEAGAEDTTAGELIRG